MEELSYSLHLSNDKNKSKKARRSIKNTETGTTSLSNNAIQNHQQLSKVDKHNLRKYDEEQELISTIKGTSSKSLICSLKTSVILCLYLLSLSDQKSISPSSIIISQAKSLLLSFEI